MEAVNSAGKLKLFRIPCCPEYTFTDDNRKRIEEFLLKYSFVPVQIFEIHSLGEKKYSSLGREMWKSEGVEANELDSYCNKLKRYGINAEVINIA